MKETGESGSTKNKTVILLLIILLTLLWFVGEILVSYHWMKVNRYPVQVRNLRYADTVTDAGFKMVVISDLHDHEFGKDNEKLIRCVKEQDPEMIILDGDMLNEDSKSDEVPVRLVKKVWQRLRRCIMRLGIMNWIISALQKGRRCKSTRRIPNW